MLNFWGDTIVVTFQSLWLGLAGILPKLIAAIVVFIVGWIIAALVGKLVTRIIRAVKVDVIVQ